jgi:hypothetical protein
VQLLMAVKERQRLKVGSNSFSTRNNSELDSEAAGDSLRCGDTPDLATTLPKSKTAPAVRDAAFRNWRLDSDRAFMKPP